MGKTVDRSFHNSANKQMKHYFSPIRDDQARGEDALAQSWEGMDAYAYPPTPIIHAVLGKIRMEKNLKVTLIAPYSPKAVWYPELLELLIEKPFIIPPIRDLLSQPLSGILHPNPAVLGLRAFRLSSIS